jgi:hypothetical protein
MTASSEPDYYERHPEARKKKAALTAAAQAFTARLGAESLPADLKLAHALNALHSTDEYVNHIRGLSTSVFYLHRDSDVTGLHPLRTATLRVLAPEEDTSIYYRRVRAHLDAPRAASPVLNAGRPDGQPPGSGEPRPRRSSPVVRPVPPPGVDATAFYRLIESMNGALGESLLSLDQAGNNTSLVLELTWRGRRLLFAGDAEQESWRMMAQHAALAPVDLLKVAHHGSRTGGPPEDILDLILPEVRRTSAVAIVSTSATEQWQGVPDADTLAELKIRTNRLYRTDEDAPPGTPVIVKIPAGDVA